jgi:hypothetical protein
MKSPSEELVEIICPLLVTDKLLLPDDIEKYRRKISAGTIKAEDWLLAMEKALAKESAQ